MRTVCKGPTVVIPSRMLRPKAVRVLGLWNKLVNYQPREQCKWEKQRHHKGQNIVNPLHRGNDNHHCHHHHRETFSLLWTLARRIARGFKHSSNFKPISPWRGQQRHSTEVLRPAWIGPGSHQADVCGAQDRQGPLPGLCSPKYNRNRPAFLNRHS